MAIFKVFDTFFQYEEEIHEYFGYKEDWVKIPLVDFRDQHWALDQYEDGSGYIIHHEEPLTEERITSLDFYSAEIYTQRFLPKWVYKAADYTLISMNPGVDGNKYLGIFDNTKKVEAPNGY